MDSQEENEIKNILKGLLISNPFRSTQQQLWKDFQEMIGRAIPLRKLGFQTFDEYLRSIPDVVQVYGSGPSGEVEAVTSKSQHINEMVLKQKKAVPKSRKVYSRPISTVHHRLPRFFQNKYSVKLPPSTNKKSESTLESPPLRVEKLDHQSETPNNSIQQPAKNVYKPHLHFNHKPQHQEENSDSPVINKNDYSNRINSDLSNQICDDSRDCATDYTEQATCLPTEISHSSEVPVKVQTNLLNLLKKFPDGIECTKFPAEYRAMYKKNIHYEEYGYRSLIEMCLDLPKIFNYVQHSSHDYMLYDKKQPLPSQDLKKNSAKHVQTENVITTHVLEDLPKLNWKTSSALLPSDVFTINDQMSRFFPADIQEEDILDITIGEIYDLSKFWFYMTFGDLDPLMDELQIFFSKNSTAYLVPELLLEEGLYCVAMYSGLYHRCVIVNMVPKIPECVRVFFVDYGTVENVPSKEIWFLPKRFGEVPCQAIRGRLANIYPVGENQPWKVSTVRRLEQLITNRVVVGKVTRVDEKDHFVDLYLADITNKDKIFYINDIFVDEGRALYIGDERKKTLVDHDCTPNVRYIHLYPEFYEIEAGMAPTTEERKYIFANKIPMHHYMPQYFDIYYNEDIHQIVRDFENFGRKRKKNIVIPTIDLEFDFSFFPDHLVDEIKELYLQDHPHAEVELSQSRKSVKSESGCKPDSTKTVVKSKSNADEIRQGTTGAAKMETGDTKNSRENSFGSKSFGDFDRSTEAAALTNTFRQLSVNNNDSGVMSITPTRISNNPFLNDCNVNTNPFRTTNPFWSEQLELEETVDTTQLLDLFAKPSTESLPDKIVNDLKNSSCTCIREKQVNVEKDVGATNTLHDVTCNSTITDTVSPIRQVQNTSQRVRTPPGFSSSNVSNNSMTVPMVAPNNFYGSPRGNPYYQRFPFQNSGMPQNPPILPYVLPPQNNYFGCVPQVYPNAYNFNALNWQQLFSQPNFRPPPRYPH
ncbi:tudor domain-containing protein 5-like isoform X2 [Zophobas morio]|uniref:tudor domain-containing protein 5-like isoform X2 n=1 Tax=Zophobas morio TaxID=2755281 RepID=UPI00308279E6